MKIRIDFVTNSSSSSFCIVTIDLKDGTVQEKELYIGEVQNNGFPYDAKTILEKMTDINELNDFINGVYNQNEDYGMDYLIKDYNFSDIKSIKLINREDISQLAGDLIVCDSTIKYDYENKEFSNNYVEREFDPEAYYERNEYVFIDEANEDIHSSDDLEYDSNDNEGSAFSDGENKKYFDPKELTSMLVNHAVGFGIKSAFQIAFESYNGLGIYETEDEELYYSIMNSDVAIEALDLVGCEKALDIYLSVMDETGKENIQILIQKMIYDASNDKKFTTKALQTIFEYGIEKWPLFKNVCNTAAGMLEISKPFDTEESKEVDNSKKENSSNKKKTANKKATQKVSEKPKYNADEWDIDLNDDGLWEVTDCHNICEKLCIPEGVQAVGNFTYGNSDLKEVIMPDSVITIENSAFTECENLERIVFSNNIEHLPGYICYNCYNLKEVVFPKKLKTIGDDAFFGCKNLKEFIAPPSLKSINISAFKNCCRITKVELNNKLETAEAESLAFSSLKELVIPESLKTIEFLYKNDTNTHIIMPHVDCNNLDFKSKCNSDVIIADGYLYSKYVKDIPYPNETAKKLEEYILANPSWFFGKIVNEPKILDFFLDNKAFDLKTAKDFMFKKGVPQEILDRLCAYVEHEFNYTEHINSMLDSKKEEFQNKATYRFGNLKNGSLSVQKYSGFEKEVVIPAFFNGKSITVVKELIVDNPFVEKIVFSENLERIDTKHPAIFNATNLKEIVLQGSITDYDLEYSFDFPFLESIYLPASIKTFPMNRSIIYKVLPNSYAESFCKSKNLKYEVISFIEEDDATSNHLQDLSKTKEQAEEKAPAKEDTSSTDMIKADSKKEFAQVEEKQKKKKGCYVATCAYGSYDCPEVWTLRRFRDCVLAKTWYGRLFILAYYFVAPKLVRVFGNSEWFKNIWRNYLDNKVEKLNNLGFENTPYDDLEW